MRNYKLTCLLIAFCGIFSVSPVHAEGDGGGFDGGFDGGDYGGDYGGDFDPGGYTDYMDQNGFDQSDAFYQQDEFNQPEDYGSFDDAYQGNDVDQVDAAYQPDNPAIEDTADGSTGTPSGNDGFAPESLKKELPDQAADTTPDINQGNQAAQVDAVGQQSGIDTSHNAGSNTESADAIQPAGSDQSAQDSVVVQDNSSTQNVAIHNSTHIDQNTGHGGYSGHGHHHGGHHHYDNFGLGFGLGLGVGLGFGFGPFGYYSPFAPFGYYGFGVPFNSFGFYSGRGVGIGFYNSYAGFGPYRYFEPYYPLGGYLAASPVFSSPMAPARAPTYIQRNEVSRPAQVQQKNYWYYCRNPEGYYPYVKQCSGQWIKVPPQPS